LQCGQRRGFSFVCVLLCIAGEMLVWRLGRWKRGRWGERTKSTLLAEGLVAARPVAYQGFLVGVDETVLFEGLSGGEAIAAFWALEGFAWLDVSLHVGGTI
jgi:hypothetical protein